MQAGGQKQGKAQSRPKQSAFKYPRQSLGYLIKLFVQDKVVLDFCSTLRFYKSPYLISQRSIEDLLNTYLSSKNLHVKVLLAALDEDENDGNEERHKGPGSHPLWDP